MKIGIDCRRILDTKFNECAGVGHYTYFLIKHLIKIDKINQYYLFLYNNKIKLNDFCQDNVKIIYFPGLESLSKIPFFYRHLFIPHILRMYKLDVYHNPAFVIPFCYLHKAVITIHDLASYKNPKWFPDGHLFNSHILIPASIYRAKKIIAVSQNTKDDLIKMFKVRPSKISVVYEGVEDYSQTAVDETKNDSKFKLNAPFFLFVGTLEPRKNIVRLIEAFNQFCQVNLQSNHLLVLAGKKGWKYEAIFEAMKNSQFADRINYVGYLNLEEKIYLLKKATALVYPSLYEGFGLPILEAMNLGVPVITSNVSSIPELVIDNALLVEPEDVNSIAQAMSKLVGDSKLAEKLSQRGRGIAQNFTWERCAKKTLEVYESLKK